MPSYNDLSTHVPHRFLSSSFAPSPAQGSFPPVPKPPRLIPSLPYAGPFSIPFLCSLGPFPFSLPQTSSLPSLSPLGSFPHFPGLIFPPFASPRHFPFSLPQTSSLPSLSTQARSLALFLSLPPIPSLPSLTFSLRDLSLPPSPNLFPPFPPFPRPSPLPRGPKL